MTVDTMRMARKAEILHLGQHAVVRRGARRRAKRHVLAMATLCAGATLTAYLLAPTPLHGPGHHVADETWTQPVMTVEYTATTPGLAQSLRVEGNPLNIAWLDMPPNRVTRVESTPAVQRISDAEALALLRDAGTPAGLIKIEGRVMLVYHHRPEQVVPGPSGNAEKDRFDTNPLTLATLPTYRPR
ncbi:MAG: hypothetical protein KIT54_05015 [Phycisphaeraceae bacterium]|nr:hypothetical protein [Phycisphaeraceae bacterium]